MARKISPRNAFRGFFKPGRTSLGRGPGGLALRLPSSSTSEDPDDEVRDIDADDLGVDVVEELGEGAVVAW